MKKLIDLIAREKPFRMLAYMSEDGIYPSKLAKLCDVTYSHVFRILKIFESSGIIKSKIEGRKRIIELTEKGEKLSKLADEILSLMNNLED